MMMDEAKQPEPLKNEPKEAFASRIERREAEIALAMKEEVERRAAVIKNMHPASLAHGANAQGFSADPAR